MTTQSLATQTGLSERAKAAIAAFLLGGALIATVGFVHASNVHNVAHDTRHSLSFPCH